VFLRLIIFQTPNNNICKLYKAIILYYIIMGLVSALFFTPILCFGVILGSPAILSLIGITAVGPVAGGLFAAAQGSAIASGSWMAAAQTIAMIAASPTP
jgi:hypothetical protein